MPVTLLLFYTIATMKFTVCWRSYKRWMEIYACLKNVRDTDHVNVKLMFAVIFFFFFVDLLMYLVPMHIFPSFDPLPTNTILVHAINIRSLCL